MRRALSGPKRGGRRSRLLLLSMIVMLHAPAAFSQSTLGELLDVGARKLTAEEFKEEVVQKYVAGPTANGGSIEMMYTQTGIIQGQSELRAGSVMALVSGEWTTDNDGRICAAMRIGIAGGTGGVATGSSGLMLPTRCQHWYKREQEYFLSDSDTDRSARVFRRTVKP